MKIRISEEEKSFLTESAFLLKEMGRFEEAKNTFKGLIALFPESDLPYIGYAEVLMAEKKLDEAELFLKETLEKFSNSEFVNFHLGEISLLKGDVEKAREFFEKKTYKNLKGAAQDYLKLIENINKK